MRLASSMIFRFLHGQSCRTTLAGRWTLFSACWVGTALRRGRRLQTMFRMLGVQISASEVAARVVSVDHTEERKTELGEAFRVAIGSGKLSPKMAEYWRGCMVFFECFAARRITSLMLKNFGALCRAERCVDDLDAEDVELLTSFKQRVALAAPIVISPRLLDTGCIFTEPRLAVLGKFGFLRAARIWSTLEWRCPLIG